MSASSLSAYRSEDSSCLLRRYATSRDGADRDELVRRFRPLARRLALRYARGSEPLDDLEQVACLGLIKAIDRYDPGRGFAFTSFAVPTILGELKRSFRDTAWSAHVPRSLQERVAMLRKATDRLSALDGRSPSVAALAETMRCSETEVLEAMDAASSLSPVSLDGPRAGAEDEDGTVVDRLGDHDAGYALVDDRAAIETALPALTDVQRAVLRLRFEGDLKQSEIGERIGVSQMQVSRILRSGLERLHTVANHQSAASPTPA
jgi:RNA polymerase sigma-B factor